MEVHGTGTAAGDLIEAYALLDAYNNNTPQLGCCKQIWGHNEVASGHDGICQNVVCAAPSNGSRATSMPTPSTMPFQKDSIIPTRTSSWTLTLLGVTVSGSVVPMPVLLSKRALAGLVTSPSIGRKKSVGVDAVEDVEDAEDG